MDLERADYYDELKQVHENCKKYIDYHIVVTMIDGSMVDGIIVDVEKDSIVVLVGEDIIEGEDINRDLVFRDGYDYNRRPKRRFRRYRRRNFPLRTLAGIALLTYPFFRSEPPFYSY